MKNYTTILEDYQNGKSTIKIAKEIGLSVSGVRKILIKNNIKLRSSLGLSRKYDIDLNMFDNFSDPWKSYLLGWLFTDGNVYKSSIRLAISEKDIDILHFFNEKIYKGTRPLKFIPSKINTIRGKSYISKAAYSLEISSVKIVEKLHSIGLVPNKSKILKFPKGEINYPFFMLGVFEGDGGVYIKDKLFVAKIHSASKEFIKGIEQYLSNNNIETSTIIDKNGVYSILIRRIHSIFKFYNLIYKDSPFHLSRKKDIFEEIFINSKKLQNEINDIKGE